MGMGSEHDQDHKIPPPRRVQGWSRWVRSIRKDLQAPCWTWYGFRDYRTNLPIIKIGGQFVLAKEYGWFIYHGVRIESGFELPTTCKVRDCLNPEHWERPEFIGIERVNLNPGPLAKRGASKRLTDSERYEIARLRLRDKWKMTQLEERYGVSEQTLYRILKTWTPKVLADELPTIQPNYQSENRPIVVPMQFEPSPGSEWFPEPDEKTNVAYPYRPLPDTPVDGPPLGPHDWSGDPNERHPENPNNPSGESFDRVVLDPNDPVEPIDDYADDDDDDDEPRNSEVAKNPNPNIIDGIDYSDPDANNPYR